MIRNLKKKIRIQSWLNTLDIKKNIKSFLWRVMEVRFYNENGWWNQWLFGAHSIGSLWGVLSHLHPSASCSSTGMFRFLAEAQTGLSGSVSRYSALPPPCSLSFNQGQPLVAVSIACKTLICKRLGNLEKKDQRHLKQHFSNFLVSGSLNSLKKYWGLQKLMFMWVAFSVLTCLRINILNQF